MDKPIWMWAVFLAVIIILLVLDLGVFHKKDKAIGVKESMWMSAFYIGIAILFGFFILYKLGLRSFEEYLTGFLIEKSLALDNIFIISLVFTSLSIPPKYQHRVLFWGILGVIILRAIMIYLGSELIKQFSWVLYIFAVFMIFTGIKMFFVSEKAVDINDNILLKWMRKHIRITNDFDGHKFFVRRLEPKSNKIKLFVTPLFVALLIIEFVDVVFAVDSVPAIFMITTDPYIVYTSNVFAILGLRALYFALASIIDRFHYLKYALAMVLIFIGSKIFIADIMGIEKFPSTVSLSITFGLLFGGVVYSLYKSKKA